VLSNELSLLDGNTYSLFNFSYLLGFAENQLHMKIQVGISF
jgi:hypothetical protein